MSKLFKLNSLSFLVISFFWASFFEFWEAAFFLWLWLLHYLIRSLMIRTLPNWVISPLHLIMSHHSFLVVPLMVIFGTTDGFLVPLMVLMVPLMVKWYHWWLKYWYHWWIMVPLMAKVVPLMVITCMWTNLFHSFPSFSDRVGGCACEHLFDRYVAQISNLPGCISVFYCGWSIDFSEFFFPFLIFWFPVLLFKWFSLSQI